MRLNPIGRIVDQTWRWLAARYAHVHLDQWVVMPNHLHGIIILTPCRGGSRTAPTTTKRKPLGRLIGAFKTVSAKRINRTRGTPSTRLWQRNYYEHIIRNDDELDQIRQYIVDNPSRWALDHENPHRAEPAADSPF
jgi:REP element-mobilizing transposase RayT